MANETWVLTRLPDGRSAIKNKWVYKTKRRNDGSVERHKARLVAKGFSQRPGIDFTETFSPVVRHESIRTILSIAATEDLEIIQLDVKTAFLNGTLDIELFMEQPDGFVVPGRENEVCLLKKNLYGLRQASRAWNSLFNEFLNLYGLIQSPADPCVYHQQNQNGLTIVAIWVDDALVCSTEEGKQRDIVEHLQSRFEMTIGSGDCFVGFEILRDRRKKTIFTTQHHYIERILNRFKFNDCKPALIPADPHSQLSASADQNSLDASQAELFREAVGCLQYTATCSRPDITYAVNQIAQHSSAPTSTHWNAVVRIFKYLRSAVAHGLCFKRSEQPNQLAVYADADYAGCVDTRRSTTGFVLMLNDGPVAWGARRQRCTSLSTTEAEYIAQSETA